MRINEKHKRIMNHNDIFSIHLQQSSEQNNSEMEVANELGLTLGEIKKIKNKITRT